MNSTKLNDGRDRFPASLAAVPACQRPDADPDWYPAMDVDDPGNEYLFEFDLPGLNRAQIQISMDRDALLLVGTQMSPPPGGMSLREKRPVGASVRRLVLPPDSCGDEIYATLQEGVLQLHVPKNTPRTENEESHTIQSEEPDYDHKPN